MSLVNVIIGLFYHLYVYMSHLTVSEGLFCYRFVYMSHAAATAGHFCHSPVYMSHFPYSLGYFSTFILYMSRLVLSSGFYLAGDSPNPLFLYRTEMFRKGKSVYLLVSITKNPGNTQLNVLPPPSSFAFWHHPQSVFLSHPYDNFSS